MLFFPSQRASIKGYLENIAEIVTTYQNKVMTRFLHSESKFITKKSPIEYKKAVNYDSCYILYK